MDLCGRLLVFFSCCIPNNISLTIHKESVTYTGARRWTYELDYWWCLVATKERKHILYIKKGYRV